MEKLIISVAVTGSMPTKQMNPSVPYSPKEIADSAVESWKAGATVAHIHVRDPNTGKPSKDFHLFREVVERIRSKCDMLLNLTTSGYTIVGMDDRTLMQKRVEPLQLKPEICSFDIGSINLNDEVISNTVPWAEFGAKRMLEVGVKPEIEIFDTGHIQIAKYLIEKGLIENPPFFQLCLGGKWTASGTAKNFLHLKELLPANAIWSVLGIGRHQFPMITMGIIEGGHVRVGFEDNIYLSKGVLAKDNAELVEKAAKLAHLLGRDVANCRDVRQILHIKD
jgi:3-keto-5-aminohexanoate cleavage enzyme